MAKKNNLCADNDQSLIRQEMFEQQLNDFRMNYFFNLIRKYFKGVPGFEEAKI